ncbi:MAG: DUF6311 domain-containing protein [Acidobacteriota bacterium]
MTARLKKERAWQVYAVAAALGLAMYVLVYGPGHLLGTTAYWQMPFADERQALIGYRYFLHQPWHWPVFASHAVNVPYVKSVAFLDCVPLWALVNKAIATVIPPWSSFSAHAYLGLWHAVVYALQACFGVACLRALGHRSWRAAIVTALFVLAVPTWIYRYRHPGLSAHWIELWALYLYLRRYVGRVWLAQLAVAALVYPYHAVLSLGVLVATLLRTRDARTIATWLPLGLATVALMTWFVGYFAAETARPQWGFEYESTNLLSWLVPLHSGIAGDGRWIANVMATPWQYEGYAYLGLGCLMLLVALLPEARTLRGVIARHAWLFAAVVACCVLALSNHVYFGSHELVAYPIPRLLGWIPRQFRSPGRFVWLPTYVLVIFLLHRGLTRFGRGRRFAVMIVAVAVQLADARGDWALQRAQTAAPSGVQLDIAHWRPLVHAHDAVFVLPPYSCRTLEEAPLLDGVGMDIEMLASERALPINGTYCARPRRKCAAEERAWPTLALQPGALYVLLPQADGVADLLAAQGASCATFEHGRVCSTRAHAIADAIAGGILRPPAPPIALAPGQKLELATWIDHSLASVLVKVTGPATTLHIQAAAELCDARATQDVDVLIDGHGIGTLHFDGASNDAAAVHSFALPRLGDPTAIELHARDLRLACTRRIGVHVERLWLE